VTADTSHIPVQDALRDAEWISPVETGCTEAGQRPAYWLRGSFNWMSGTAASERAVVRATAHGIYELFVNGTRVGNDELTPGFTSYRKRLQVQQWDITDLLVRGENVVAALLSDGWFRGRHGFERRADGFGTETAFLASVNDATGRRPSSPPAKAGSAVKATSPMPTSWTGRPPTSAVWIQPGSPLPVLRASQYDGGWLGSGGPAVGSAARGPLPAGPCRSRRPRGASRNCGRSA
jgi:hypothetical protein